MKYKNMWFLFFKFQNVCTSISGFMQWPFRLFQPMCTISGEHLSGINIAWMINALHFFSNYFTRYLSHIYRPLWTASWSAILHFSRTFIPFFSSALAIFSVTAANQRFEKNEFNCVELYFLMQIQKLKTNFQRWNFRDYRYIQRQTRPSRVVQG